MACVVWVHGDDVRTNLDLVPELSEKPTLELALAAATGFAQYPVMRIPAILMPEKLSFALLEDPEKAKRLDDATLENANCFRIQVAFEDTTTTAWIDRSSFLVRRIVETIVSEQIRIETTVDYHPEFDVDMPGSAFEYDPPPSPGKVISQWMDSANRSQMSGSLTPDSEPIPNPWRERIGWPWGPAIIATLIVFLLLVVFASRHRRKRVT